jgi:arylsulfatase
MVVVWPKRIQPDSKPRSQFLHVIDIVPTILEAAGLPAPKVVNGVEQKPMDGVSFFSTFTDAAAPEVRTRQYFEVFSNRGIYDNGWYACTQHTLPWRQDYAPGNWENDKWELYNLNEDFSLANDLAAKHPEKLKAMKALFYQEAEKYHVYPLDDRGTGRLISPKPAPGGSDPNRTRFTYYAGATRLAETASPNTKNKSHAISAVIEMPEKGGAGVLVAAGGLSAGYSLYVQDGRLIYEYNWFDDSRYIVKSSEALPPGKSTVKMDFTYDGGGSGKGGKAILFVNDNKVGEGRIEKTVASRFGIDTFGVGEDTGSPVSLSYKPPFAFNGRIEKVEIELQ